MEIHFALSNTSLKWLHRAQSYTPAWPKLPWKWQQQQQGSCWVCWDREFELGPQLGMDTAGGRAQEGHSYCQGSRRAQLLPGLLSATAWGPTSPPAPSPCPTPARKAPGDVIGDSPPTLSQRSAPALSLHTLPFSSSAHPDTWGIALPPHCLSSSHSSRLAHTHPAQQLGLGCESAPER